MSFVTIAIILCSLPAGLGVIVDRLMLKRHKGRLHDALLRYWVHLDELSLPDIWRVFATYTIKFFTKLIGKEICSFRSVITLTIISFCLTICALSLGALFEEATTFASIFYSSFLLLLLFINLVFDTLTGLVTVKVLSVIRRSTPGKAIAFIVMDIILAMFFAIACIDVLLIIRNISVGDPLFTLFLSTTISHITYLFTVETGSGVTGTLTSFLYSCTAFIPTLIYLILLGALIISKTILEVGIRVTKYLLESATEVDNSKNLAVFTLTGSLFSVIVLLLTAFTKLWRG